MLFIVMYVSVCVRRVRVNVCVFLHVRCLYVCICLHVRWVYRLVHSYGGGDLCPQPGVLDRRDGLLGVAVHVQVQHQATERRTDLVR